MIKSFRHRGLENFYLTGSKAGIIPNHAPRLAFILTHLNRATCPTDMAFPGLNLHPLLGQMAGHYSVKVSANWRMTFKFDGEDVTIVDYQDYH